MNNFKPMYNRPFPQLQGYIWITQSCSKSHYEQPEIAKCALHKMFSKSTICAYKPKTKSTAWIPLWRSLFKIIVDSMLQIYLLKWFSYWIPSLIKLRQIKKTISLSVSHLVYRRWLSPFKHNNLCLTTCTWKLKIQVCDMTTPTSWSVKKRVYF